ncbi:MAG: DMT family transporter [Candidatus Devosia phytovorans]|uniref:DMT family transporter n=1 Tax=Candidatus Devosia phytovorans TaxID=3121372 RepID=A0AAJ5VUZ5_9HYPH|nr:DMT family transporter [Devosia sp.]WEK05366.1 MAG: DMT family transporter [Devosia sp.]
MRVAIAALTAMVAFAANSVLARLALGSGEINAMSYTGWRLLAGAVVLAALLGMPGQRGPRAAKGVGGSWWGAGCLLGYALAFSIAYVMLGAASGAIILFASVQIGMLAWAVLQGDRPGWLEWSGIGVAFAAFVGLVLPGAVAPPALGSGLMLLAGLCWAGYSLLGKGSQAPLQDTAGNFIRCLPAAVLLLILGLPQAVTATGVGYAVVSGGLASGLGYAVWYAVLPRLPGSSPASIQLSVPAIAAAGGVVFLGEHMSGRLLTCSAGIICGLALALYASNRRKA